MPLRSTGKQILLGNLRLMEREQVALNGLGPKAEQLQAEAKTAMWLAVDGQASALIGVADTIKDGSNEAVAALHKQGLLVVMMTGDNQATAQMRLPAEVGIDRVFAEVLPGDKAALCGAAASRRLSSGHGRRRHQRRPGAGPGRCGLAIGTGTDVAMETADVTLMRGDLRSVPQAIKLSKATMRNIHENLIWAFGYNVALIPIAAGVLAPVRLGARFPAPAAPDPGRGRDGLLQHQRG